MLNRSIKSSNKLISRFSKMSYSTIVEDDVIFSNVNNTKIVTLNRPKKLNALNESMILKLHPRFEEYSKSEITDLIIQNSNGRAFCAGGDVASCAENNLNGNSNDSIKFFLDEYSLNYLLATYPKPIVSIQNGITMGGGVGLAVHTPFRIATEKTLWAMPEMDIGFFPDVGTTFALNKLVSSSFGWFLALTGEKLAGLDNYFSGLSTHYIPSERLAQLEKELTRVNLKNDDKFEIINNLIENFTEPLPSNYQFKYSVNELKLIDKVFHESSTMESIFSDLKDDGSEFALNTLEILKKKSLLSLKVALELLQRGSKSDIFDSLTNELNAANQFMKKSDFNEAVSSKLIRKSKDAPNWTFNSLNEITVKDLLPFFKRDPNLHLKPHFNITFNQYPHNFALPKTSDIKAFIGSNESSSRNDIIKHFAEGSFKNKVGLVKYLNFVLDVKTESTDDLLKWKL